METTVEQAPYLGGESGSYPPVLSFCFSRSVRLSRRALRPWNEFTACYSIITHGSLKCKFNLDKSESMYAYKYFYSYEHESTV